MTETTRPVQDAVLSEPIVVDRSPELARNPARPNGLRGGADKAIVITRDDVRNSKRGDGAQCAIARVITRETGITDINLATDNPTINGRPAALGIDLINWIGRFDRGEDPGPLTIYLNTRAWG